MDGGLHVLSILSPEQVTVCGGLPPEAIAGSFDRRRGADSPATFLANPVFSTFMHRVIDTCGRHDPELRASAREQGSGSLSIIDLRTPEGVMGRVPMEDIVGIFEIRDGELGVYYANDRHVLFSAHGLVQLPSSLQALHLRELLRLRVPST